MKLREDGQDRYRIGRRQDGSKNHTVDKADVDTLWMQISIQECQDTTINLKW